jgi:hypothetical protein
LLLAVSRRLRFCFPRLEHQIIVRVSTCFAFFFFTLALRNSKLSFRTLREPRALTHTDTHHTKCIRDVHKHPQQILAPMAGYYIHRPDLLVLT